MRTCEEYEALISAFIDGALDEESRAELMEHMAGCPACQAYFDDQIAIHDALEGMEAQAPAGLTARVMEQVGREPRQAAAPEQAEKKTVAFPYWRRFAAMAACCALVALAGFWAFGGQPDTGNVAADVAAGDASRGLAGGGASDAAAEDDSAVGAMDAPDAGDTADTAVIRSDGAAEEAGEQDPAALPADSAANAADGEKAVLPPETFQDNSAAAPETDLVPGQNALTTEGGGTPALYTAGQSAQATLTTGSQVAADWVAETLGRDWQAGESYALTREQYGELLALLEESGESYTATDPVQEDGEGLYVLQAVS